MLEAPAREGVDGAVDDAYGAAPLRPAVAVGNARAAPAHANLARAVTRLVLQVPVPDAAAMVVGCDLVPALQSQEPVVDPRRAVHAEFVALDVIAAAGESYHPLAAGGESMARAQRAADGGAIQLVGDDAGDAAFRAEHLGAGKPSARPAAMLV